MRISDWIQTCALPISHLRPAGKPGPQLSALLAASAHGRDGLRQKRSRADEGHLAFQYVPELRQFVQPGPAQKAANRGNPLVVRKKLAARIAGVTHLTKLDELERRDVLTRPPLAAKYRAARRDQDAAADKQDKGGKKRETDRKGVV